MKISYKGFSVVERKAVLGDKLVSEGYNVTDGGVLQVMPGAVWFNSIESARDGIDRLLETGMIHFTISSPIYTSNPLILQHLKEIPIPINRQQALDRFYHQAPEPGKCMPSTCKSKWSADKGIHFEIPVSRIKGVTL